jgi:hypothetical protein
VALLWIVLLAIWTVVFARLICARATLSERTFATYLVMGAFLGLSIMPFIQKLLDPYGDGGAPASWMVSLGRQAALLIPVAAALFLRRRSAAISVADAFLLAFTVGFGFDLVCALLTSASATQPIQGLSFFPPGQFDTPTFSLAGYGFWCGLVAVAIIAMKRFVRKTRLTLIVAAAVFLFVVTEQASLFPTPAADSVLTWFGTITFHGKVTGWIAILAVIALSLLESRWLSRVGASAAGEFQLLKDMQSLGGLLARLRFREFVAQSRAIGLRRQENLVRAEVHYSPNDPALPRLLARIEQARQSADASNASGASVAGTQMPLWKNPLVLFSAPWVAIALIVFVLPLLPDSVIKAFWSPYSILNFQWGSLPTLLNIALLVILVRRYILAADRPDRAGEADDRIQFRAESAILKTALGAVLLVVLYGSIANLYGALPSYLAYYTGAALPRFENLQLTTLWLLFAVAATGFVSERSKRWQHVPAPEHRRAALHNALMVLGGFFVGWICLGIYNPTIALAQQNLGPWLFNTFAARGNYVVAELTAVVLASIGAGVAFLWGKLSGRAEKYMLGR